MLLRQTREKKLVPFIELGPKSIGLGTLPWTADKRTLVLPRIQSDVTSELHVELFCALDLI